MDLFKAIKHLYPDLDVEQKVELVDRSDGKGIVIETWKTHHRKPSIQELITIWEDIENDLLLENIRNERNRLLSECDWTQLPDASLTKKQKQSWIDYRQELKDFPKNCDLKNPVFPTKPS